MTEPETRAINAITGWHAHVYFDADSRDEAAALYDAVKTELADTELGRFHERPVGPHPVWNFQIAFAPEQFATVIPWLGLNRHGLDVFVHPDTGDHLTDHTKHVMWLGRSYELNTAMFDKSAN